MSDKTPTTKVAAAGVAVGPAVGLALVVQWVLGEFGIDMPETVAMALASVIPVIVAYIVRSAIMIRVVVMPQSDHGGDITLGELGRRMDAYQTSVSSSIQTLTDKLDDRPSHADLANVRDQLRREVSVETAARTVSEAATAATLTAMQESNRYSARTAISAIITTVVSVVTAVVVFVITR